MDILMGYDNPRNTHMPGHDVCAILKELGTYFKEATILESSLISLSHMQVDVCFLRGSSGLARFRKNIISFHQDLLELKHYYSFLTNLMPRHSVNVTSQDAQLEEL